MNRLLKILTEARYIVLIISIFIGIFVFYDGFVNDVLTYRVILRNLFLLTFPTFVLHAACMVVRARNVRLQPEAVLQPATTFGLEDRAFVYTYLILVLGCALGYVAFIDDAARDAARIRADRTVPNPHDSRTWALPPSSTSPEDRVLPSVPLSRESLFDGRVALRAFTFMPYGTENSSGFGTVRFENGVATSCEPLSSNNFYTCEAFQSGMLTLKDVALLSATTTTRTYTEDGRQVTQDYEIQTGLILAERSFNDTVDTVLLYVTNQWSYPNSNAFSVVELISLSADRADEVAFESVQNITELKAGRYDRVRIRFDEKVTDHIFEIVFGRNGDSFTFAPYDDGVMTKGSEVSFAEPVSDAEYPEFTPRTVGTLFYTFTPSTYVWQSGWQGRAGYSEWTPEGPVRVYYQAACNLPNTYTDVRSRIQTNDLSLTLDVSIPQSANYNLTTTYYGYEPNEWGKILSQPSVILEHAAVQSAAAVPGRTTSKVLIAGMTVRHTLPAIGARPCDVADSQQMYQWVKDGNLYSVTHTADSVEESVAAQPVIEGIIAELIAGLSYVPAQ